MEDALVRQQVFPENKCLVPSLKSSGTENILSHEHGESQRNTELCRISTHASCLHLVCILEVPNVVCVKFALVFVIQKPELFLTASSINHIALVLG